MLRSIRARGFIVGCKSLTVGLSCSQTVRSFVGPCQRGPWQDFLVDGIGRLIVDPYSLLLFSSRAEDFNAINAKRAAGMSVSAAIDAVLRERILEHLGSDTRRLTEIEAAEAPTDPMVTRTAVFDLIRLGRIDAPALRSEPLCGALALQRAAGRDRSAVRLTV